MSDLLAGRATAAATAAYRDRLLARGAHPGHFRSLDGLALSSLGLGTYLGSTDDATDALYGAAARRALELGINVLDTAINYRAQRSERVLGAALRAAIADGLVRREEVVVASKGGFLPFDGGRPADARAYVERTYVAPGLMARSELVAGCHCLAPRYLADQLERSRRNLGLATIDIYYLHNPETQLDEVPRAELLRRMRAAFALLERACADGLIGCYGTATWSGYRQPMGAPDRLDLGELVAQAREVGGAAHRFRVLQLPFNAGMPEALTAPTQPAPLLEAAADRGFYVMSSGSVLQGRLAESAPPALRRAFPELATDAQRALQLARSAPGVGTALVGMKRVAHVEENAALALVAPASAEAVRAVVAA